MREGTFVLGSVHSQELPVFISQRPAKAKAKRVFTLEEIPGVNRLVPFDKGYYTNAEQTLNCFYLANSTQNVQWFEDRITEALDTRGQYTDFIPYYDENYIYDVIVINEPKFEGTRGTQLAVPFSFDLSVAPFKKNIRGKIAVEASKEFVLFNPENYPSDPYIKIEGSGNITLYINDRSTVLENVSGTIEIDSDPDVMEVYKESNGMLLNENKKMKSNQPFPFLDKGKNIIKWKGNVKKLIIEPRWQTKI